MTRRKKIVKTPGQSILTGVRQAIAWASGEPVPVRETVVQIPQVDVKAVRRRMGLSQEEFARKFGFARASVRNWEQGRRQAEGPARILLAVIDFAPQTVEAVLQCRSHVPQRSKSRGKSVASGARETISRDTRERISREMKRRLRKARLATLEERR